MVQARGAADISSTLPFIPHYHMVLALKGLRAIRHQTALATLTDTGSELGEDPGADEAMEGPDDGRVVLLQLVAEGAEKPSPGVTHHDEGEPGPQHLRRSSTCRRCRSIPWTSRSSHRTRTMSPSGHTASTLE